MSPRQMAGVAWTVAVLALGLVPAAALAEPGQTGPPAIPLPPERPETVDLTGTRAPASDFEALRKKEGTVRVIVGLQTRFTPEGALGDEAVKLQRGAIDVAREQLVRSLDGTKHEVVNTFETVPSVALELDQDALTALERSGQAASIAEDELSDPELLQSTSIVEATEAETLGRDGSGQHVAILDTGVDKAHSFLAGKVVSEACFSAGDCPGGVSSSTATGSGVPCTYSTGDCQHGTHVAGIAAGSGTAFDGVAQAAGVIAINVFSRFDGAADCAPRPSPCARSFTSDQIKGLERVIKLRSTLRIAAVNMSLGGGQHTSNCDTDSRKPVIDNLRSTGIATVISSGNSGFSNAVGAPACISSAITVGSTTKGDAVSGFSNSASMVELLAPGTGINSSVPGGGFAPKDGTSMAAPHVTGAWAVLKELAPGASVPTVLGHLQTTGKPITDPDNGISKPRIRVLSASTRIADTGLRPGADFSLPNGGVTSNGVSLATRAGAPSTGIITITGLPAGATVQHAALYWMTIGGPDTHGGLQRRQPHRHAGRRIEGHLLEHQPARPQPRLSARVPDRRGDRQRGLHGRRRRWHRRLRRPGRVAGGDLPHQQPGGPHGPHHHPPRRAVLDGVGNDVEHDVHAHPPGVAVVGPPQRGGRRRSGAVHRGPDDVRRAGDRAGQRL